MMGSLSAVKRRRLEALADPRGVIAALAMDQRKSLRKMMAAVSGNDWESVPDSALTEFKIAVTEILSPHSSAVLLDPEYGLAATERRDAGCGLLLTYEQDGFENPRPHRMLSLLANQTVRRLQQAGADAIKVLLSFTPDGDAGSNEEKKCWVERIGHECASADVPFLLEPVVYDATGGDPRSAKFARRKPDLVLRTIEEFSRPFYHVDVLKVEFPVSAIYVGNGAGGSTSVFSRAVAMDLFRSMDSATGCPYIYLSAGVSTAEFLRTLDLAAESGARFSGVLCGRANWQDGIPAYLNGGRTALSSWLRDVGVGNMMAIHERLRAATPWTERTRQ